MGGRKQYNPVENDRRYKDATPVARSQHLTDLINPYKWRALALAHTTIMKEHPNAPTLSNQILCRLCIAYDIRMYGRRCPEFLASITSGDSDNSLVHSHMASN